jgi:hypothetical protein
VTVYRLPAYWRRRKTCFSTQPKWPGALDKIDEVTPFSRISQRDQPPVREASFRIVFQLRAVPRVPSFFSTRPLVRRERPIPVG